MNHLIIGNKNYSSWSLRPWLLLKEKGIEFKETKVPLYMEGSRGELLKYSPTGLVPVFQRDKTVVWDSMAICEFIADVYSDKNCWPEKLEDRALARSICNEMHSGFLTLRNTLNMNCRLEINFGTISKALQMDIDRICEIFRSCRSQYSKQGDFLFGDFSIADAMFAPVVLRFYSYGIKVESVEQEYMNKILSLKSIQEWVAEGKRETELIKECEVILDMEG